ncbi:MAG: glutamate carboxypeptidase [Vicinamibacterales bacterium]
MLRLSLALVALLVPAVSFAQANQQVLARAQAERQPMLDTMRELVGIESGSSDYEGVTRIAGVIAERLRALGGEIEMVPAQAGFQRFANTPERLADSLVARFRGRGTRRILLLAHMDTVYQRGSLAQQPFRIDGDRAYGLGIADDKHGVALIIHTLTILRALNFDQYGLITVLINGSEEVASPASRALIAQLGSEHDITFSCEGAGADDAVRLATTGIQNAILTVKGRASHAGVAPQDGRNALYELSHQILQMRDLSDPSRALKVNWTIASAGSVFNAIPADARAVADMRADDPREFAAVEAVMRERIKKTLIPDTTVDVMFEAIFPPLPLREQSQRAAAQAQQVYAEIGRTLAVRDVPTGGGTDAAYAAQKTNAPVIEGFGLKGFGAHSSNAEYIEISSIEPRLYLLTRMIMDVADGRVALPQ